MLRTLRAHLFALVLATVLPATALLAYLIYDDMQHSVAQAKASMRTLVRIAAAGTSRFLSGNREAMEQFAKRPLVRRMNGRHCDPVMQDFRDMFPRFANLTTITPAGIAVCSAVPQPDGKPVDISKTEWFRRALAERRFLAGNPFIGPITGRWVSVLVAPIQDERGSLAGFVGLPLDLKLYGPSLEDSSLAPGMRMGIVTGDGHLVWRNEDPDKLIGTYLGDTQVMKSALATRDGTFRAPGTDGVERFYAVTPIPEVGWYAYVGVPTVNVYGKALEETRMTAFFGLLGLVASLFLAMRQARRIARPISAISTAARAIDAGDKTVRAPIGGPSEVVEVAVDFNKMVDNWMASVAEIRKAEEQVRKLNQDLERRVADRTAELELANKELEAFSYSVSHDLRAPLRAVDGYSRILDEDFRDKLDSEGVRLLAQVRANTQRMGDLIADILEFSRLGRRELAAGDVDMNRLAREVAEELQSTAAGRVLRFDIGDLPPAQGDSVMIRQVLVNLLANAVKFTRLRPEAVIAVGGRQEAGENVYFVKDNGAGFDMQYVGKLFGVFERLHTQQEFEGTGIGLAIVKRIVTRHGGKVWAEGGIDAGATFHFSLPSGAPAPAAMQEG